MPDPNDPPPRLQKNPHAERQAEDELPEVDYQMEVAVHLNRSAAISPHISERCAEAGGATFSRHQDIQHVAAHRGQFTRSSVGMGAHSPRCALKVQ